MTTYTYTTIDPPGSGYSVAESINNKGQIVGFYQNSSGQEFGFLDHGGRSHGPGALDAVAPADGPNCSTIVTAGKWLKVSAFLLARLFAQNFSCEPKVSIVGPNLTSVARWVQDLHRSNLEGPLWRMRSGSLRREGRSPEATAA